MGVAAVAAAMPAVASAHTKTVYAGPPPSTGKLAGKILGKGGKAFLSRYNPDINDFFRHRVTVNQGDTVSFVLNGFHTVDLPGKSGNDLPLFVSGKIVTGVLDAAGTPFWFNGHVPSLGFNPSLSSPTGKRTYDGSSRIDSGFPSGSGPPKPLKVTFTKPGTYKYFCDVHAGMIGYVVVKPKGKPVPSVKQDAAAVTEQLTTDIRSAKALAKTKPGPDQVSLGASNSSGVELFTMFPATLTVKVGTVVKFSMSRSSREVHTATFGPAKYLAKLANSPAPPANSLYPSDPVQPIPLDRSSHGNGFANTGALDRDSDTPSPGSGTIKFTQAGTYHYICLIHAFMHGTIVVK